MKYIIEHLKDGLTVFIDSSGKNYASIESCIIPFNSLNDAVVYALNNLKGNFRYIPHYSDIPKQPMDPKQIKQDPTSLHVSNCTFSSSDTYNIDIQETIGTLADAVRANAEAISSICSMITSLPLASRPAMISFSPDKIETVCKETKKAT